jgi:hypothetical protein
MYMCDVHEHVHVHVAMSLVFSGLKYNWLKF